jgi:hypothetical protein
MMRAPGSDDGGNRVLEDELFLIIGLEHERVFIEALDSPRKFHAAEEIDGNQSLFLARIIQKAVLYVLRRFVHGASKRPEKLKKTARRADCILTQLKLASGKIGLLTPHNASPSGRLCVSFLTPHNASPSGRLCVSFLTRTTPGPSGRLCVSFLTPHNAGPSDRLCVSFLTPHNAGPSGPLCVSHLTAQTAALRGPGRMALPARLIS